ncbi:hypothetical protein [Nostoc sp. LEGE 12450]|uniref:hypothetical protein n=1 Tax=Nostoc sp. LEGE 12450 TaxID=1828643 RepID=UPI001880C8A7|nr:hypothetical protein [Nostoc sp. LEGE 12450]MBE8991173.1 hypothetical protein [Nostoc sp. LEGE 12450]
MTMPLDPLPDTAASFPPMPPPHHPACTQFHRTLQSQFSAVSPTQTNPSQQIWPVWTPFFSLPYKQQTRILVN